MFTIFYAWQSDHPSKLNRDLIRTALDIAVEKLTLDPELQVLDRRLEIDQDTLGEPGSPNVADTILRKILTCDAFVADLTYVAHSEDGTPVPNPNVMFEYGYALSVLGEARIIAVFNKAFGPPDKLPFDLQHRRWPIRYEASDDGRGTGAKKRREETTKELAEMLAEAIKVITKLPAKKTRNKGYLQVPSISGPLDNDPSSGQEFPDSIPVPWRQGVIGGRAHTDPSDPDYQVQIVAGPHLSMKVRFPNGFQNRSDVENLQRVRKYLLPLGGARTKNCGIARNAWGPVVFLYDPAVPNIAISATQFFSWGDLVAVDFHLLHPKDKEAGTKSNFIPTGAVEEVFIDGLLNAIIFARDGLNTSTRISVTVGLVGVQGFRLAVNPRHSGGNDIVGNIFSDQIGYSLDVDSYDEDPFDLLLPFFNRIYDAAGEVRPDIRTSGRLRRPGKRL